MLISTKGKKINYTKPCNRIFQIDKSVTDQQQKAHCKTSLNKTLHMLPKVLDRSLPLSKAPAHNLYIIYMACGIAVYVSYYAIEYAIAKKYKDELLIYHLIEITALDQMIQHSLSSPSIYTAAASSPRCVQPVIKCVLVISKKNC